ncbi:MAG: hypothetical protein V2I33_19450, partial [Kangiellaceae bacterium]|nr:hypothetical protein [Kangiellaceae bacterium]
KKTGTILVLSNQNLSKIKNGKIVKTKPVQNGLNHCFNTPCTLVNEYIYYVSECVPYRFNLRTCQYEALE